MSSKPTVDGCQGRTKGGDKQNDESGSDSDSSSSAAAMPKSQLQGSQSANARIDAPLETDVLMGRGKRSQHHPGNLKMRDICKVWQAKYLDSQRHQKRALTIEVLSLIKAGGTRFLERVDTDDGTVWYQEAEYAAAFNKVGHALRAKQDSRRRRKQREIARAAGVESSSTADILGDLPASSASLTGTGPLAQSLGLGTNLPLVGIESLMEQTMLRQQQQQQQQLVTGGLLMNDPRLQAALASSGLPLSIQPQPVTTGLLGGYPGLGAASSLFPYTGLLPLGMNQNLPLAGLTNPLCALLSGQASGTTQPSTTLLQNLVLGTQPTESKEQTPGDTKEEDQRI